MFSVVLERKKFVCFVLGGILLVAGCYLFVPAFWKTARVFRSSDQPQMPTELSVDFSPHSGSSEEFFVDCRMARERVRSKKMEFLEEIADNPYSSSEVREQAQKELLALVERAGKEEELEKLILARGFQDSIVIINEDTVIAIVGTASLSPSEKEELVALIAKVAGVKTEDIFVINRSHERT